MRRFLPVALPLVLAILPAMAPAQTIHGIDWQLIAIDGALTETRATLRIEEDGVLSGQAPCNRWSSMNSAPLPAVALHGISATRMACDKLSEEQAFFEVLSLMTALQPEGDSTLILTGPDGRSMEFARDTTDSETSCKTCKPAE